MIATADSTGGSTVKNAKGKENANSSSIPESAYKFFPTIQDQGLNEKANQEKLSGLFQKYLKPQSSAKGGDIKKEWSK
jgi:hypothetical protein